MTRTSQAALPAHPRVVMLARLLVTGLLTVLSGAGLALAQAAPTAAVTVSTSLATSIASTTYERRVQYMVNLERNKHGLPALRSSRCADGTSSRWSHHLATKDRFYHQSMTTVLNECDARYAGETLGRGSISPKTLVRMWMESPGHRAILMSRSPRRIGIGAEQDRYGRWVVAANFITR